MIKLFAICLAVGGLGYYLSKRWSSRIEAVRTNHAKFKEYMKILDEEEAVNDLLGQFNNADELRKATMELKKCLKKYHLSD